MPEGDAVYRFAARLRLALEGKPVLAARSHGPGPVPRVERLIGASCAGVETHGKNLFIHFDNGLSLRGHLRMYGTWHVYAPGARFQRPERELRLVLEVPGAVVVNIGAPVIELIETRALALHRPVASLGPDLLDDDFDAGEALRRLREPSRAELTVGDALMDQSALAGVGNIWKHETLFRCGMFPWRRLRDLSDEELLELIGCAQCLLRASVGKPLPGSGDPPRRPSMWVYGRRGQACRRCGTRLRWAPQGRDIRDTIWCPRCQPAREGDPAPGSTWAASL